METDIRRKMFAHTHISFNSLTGLVNMFPSPVYSLDAPLSRLVALGMEMEVAFPFSFQEFIVVRI